jgi:hypothetical protein
MKSMMMSVVALLCAGALTACSGTSTIGSGDEPGTGASANGTGASANGMGGAEVVPGAGGASKGGKDPGMGGAAQLECARDEDCAVDLTCQLCPDGSELCSKAVCLPGGKCARQEPICSSVEKCDTGKDCPVLDLPCKDCGDGSQACPTAACVMGVCQNSFSGCTNLPGSCDKLACGAPCDSKEKLFCNEKQQCQPEPPMGCAGECKTAMDCGPVDANCQLCDDGSCAKIDCVEGKCQLSCESTANDCKVSEDCPSREICIKCPVTEQCAVQACIEHSCQMVCPVE